MPAQLVSLTDGPNILIDKPILLIGRHAECDIQIDSRKISRRHCCIAQVADYLVVRDLGSTNGVRINGVRVLEGRLNENDELMIGGCRYRVSWQAVGGALPQPEQPRRVKAEQQRPAPAIAVDEEERLEACDEPVPLIDPVGVQPHVAAHNPPLPPAGILPPREQGAERSPRGPRVEPPSEPIVPEELKLAPASDGNRQNAGTS
jgi:predicted component of type VI protein secretion system